MGYRLWNEGMSMRTELGKVRGLGSAKSGTEHFWKQRLTAIANVPLVIYLLYFILSHVGAPRAAVVASIKNPLCDVALCLAMVSILWHMRLGLQVVVEDYVHSEAKKLATLLAINFAILFLGALVLYAILKMSFVL
jgi:succinate dehydrogenase / fumarate reductase, membrane anchor subunit